MLPVKLKLRNFLSYGDAGEELDFRAFRLACISGNNGEGKSALLDAITWALWGMARGTDYRGAGSDDLINVGADEAEVLFEFEVSGALWRVERRRKRGRAGGGLSLFHLTPNGWESAGGATATLTQRHLNSLLGLDYQTFINSAFLLQGRADEFARQGASDRKRILADILGLGLFESLSERARTQAREADSRAEFLELEITRLQEETARADELQQRLQELEQRLATAGKELEQARAAQQAQQELLGKLEARQRQAEELARVMQRIGERTAELEQELAQSRQRLAEYQELLARETEIEAGFARLQEKRAEEREWRVKAAQFSELRHRRELQQLALQQEKAQLEIRAEGLIGQVKKLAVASRDEEIRARLAGLREEIGGLEAERQQAAEVQEGLRSNREQAARLAERLRQLQGLAEEKRDRQALLQQAQAVCPVCRQQLSDAQRQELLAELKKEQQAVASETAAGKTELARLNTATSEQQAQLRQLEKRLLRLPELKRSLGQQEGMLAQARAAKEQLEAAQAELAGLEARLGKADFAPEARIALAAVERELADLAYDAAAYRALTDQVAALTRFEQEKQQLDRARSAAAAYLASQERAEINLKTAREEQHAAQDELAQLQRETAALPAEQARLTDLADKAEAAQQEVIGLEQQRAVAQSELSRLAEKRQLLDRRRKEKEQAQEEHVIHSNLAAAFGKNGLQALIIETALPQLEEHTNELLDRLTEGRMQVSFQTQKERGGQLAETLEIRIRDESGERRYEMYSGGEAFRLNFAIRLALSRLLTQRAGAKLSTLVIDEGFGSQDAEGRQRLVEAIRAVAGDFDRIIVITHLDELKAEFAHRIEVSKDATGSHVRQVG